MQGVGRRSATIRITGDVDRRRARAT